MTQTAIFQVGAITVCTLWMHRGCESEIQFSCHLSHAFQEQETLQPAPHLSMEAHGGIDKSKAKVGMVCAYHGVCFFRKQRQED